MRLRVRDRRKRGSNWTWARYVLGRTLQVTGLMITLVAATAFFGTPSTIAMLRMMLVGVLFFIPGWLLSRVDPREDSAQRQQGHNERQQRGGS
jgi:hypothetical protein